jgi:hypothetical protein
VVVWLVSSWRRHARIMNTLVWSMWLRWAVKLVTLRYSSHWTVVVHRDHRAYRSVVFLLELALDRSDGGLTVPQRLGTIKSFGSLSVNAMRLS